MRGCQYGKGLIYLRAMFQLTKLAFLRARTVPYRSPCCIIIYLSIILSIVLIFSLSLETFRFEDENDYEYEI